MWNPFLLAFANALLFRAAVVAPCFKVRRAAPGFTRPTRQFARALRQKASVAKQRASFRAAFVSRVPLPALHCGCALALFGSDFVICSDLSRASRHKVARPVRPVDAKASFICECLNGILKQTARRQLRHHRASTLMARSSRTKSSITARSSRVHYRSSDRRWLERFVDILVFMPMVIEQPSAIADHAKQTIGSRLPSCARGRGDHYHLSPGIPASASATASSNAALVVGVR
jgi:hypothetical protein